MPPPFAPLRVGYVKYLNTLPLVHGLDACRDAEPVPAAPADLGAMLADGRVDVALVSLVDAAVQSAAGSPLTLLPAGCIACDGPTLTVRVFSRVPIDRVRRLHADTESHTSVALARLLLGPAGPGAHAGHAPWAVPPVSPEIVPYTHPGDSDLPDEPPAEAPAGPPAGTAAKAPAELPETLLLIGDKAVSAAPPPSTHPHTLDLGQAWHERTGLPFVYALWMCRAADAGSPRTAAIVELLDRQRRRNLHRLDWIIAHAAPQRRWPPDLARTYLTQLLRFELTPRARRAIDLFFDLAARAGVLPSYTPAWHTPPHTPAHAHPD